jgi:hypothetical protein
MGNFPSQSTGEEFFFVFFSRGYDEAIGTFGGISVVVVLMADSGGMFSIVK